MVKSSESNCKLVSCLKLFSLIFLPNFIHLISSYFRPEGYKPGTDAKLDLNSDDISIIKDVSLKFHQYFRIAVLTEIQNKLFTVDTMNQVYVYDITDGYKETNRFRIAYNVLIAVNPYYFLTSSVISDTIDLYDVHSVKIIKKIPKVKLSQPFIGYLEKSKKVYMAGTSNTTKEMLLDAGSMRVQNVALHKAKIQFMTAKDIGTIKELYTNVVVI